MILSQLRKNVPYNRTGFDMNDPLLVKGPAKGGSRYVLQLY